MRKAIEAIGRGLYGVATIGCATEHTFSRFKMHENIRAAAAGKKYAGPCLSISHSQHLLELLGVSGVPVTEANYPDINICQLPFAESTFGLIVSDQVLEHVDDLPSRAMSETLRVLMPNGWLLHTTCFRMPYHGPGDYWRFTAEGLRSLALRCGAVEAISGTEGHPVELLTNLLGWGWLGVPKANWHPLRWLAKCDHPSRGSTVWVLARK